MRQAAWEQCQGGEEGGMGRGQGVFGVWGEMGTAEVARVRLNQDVFLRLISAVRAGPLQPGQPGLHESCTSPDRLSPFLPDLSLRLQAASLQSS